MVNSKRRGGVSSVKSKHHADEKHILLSRGLSARYAGVNVPLTVLAPDEMEHDLRHIEAFSNACVAYSQQYFIYLNQNELNENDNLPQSVQSGNNHNAPQPLVAMPVRIDPEEEKRVATLRQKIQHTEAQREVMESQYLSLRAHYVYISQALRKLRSNINIQLDFLQSLLRKRGKLVAFQRVRLQMARDVLACLQYRQAKIVKGKKGDAEAGADDDDNENEDGMKVDDEAPTMNGQNGESSDLLAMWNQIDEKFRRAEALCQEEEGSEVMAWSALKVPKTAPGVPLLLSQLSRDPGYGAAYACNGMFGSSPHDLCWLVENLVDYTETAEKLVGLRSENTDVHASLQGERDKNRNLQTKIIACRKRNDELVAMMTFLRTETEAVVARHNILLESKEGKDASSLLHEKEEGKQPTGKVTNGNAKDSTANGSKNGGSSGNPKGEAAGKATGGKALPNENHDHDGDDEGEVGEDDDEEEEDGEVVGASIGEGAAKRSLEAGAGRNFDTAAQKNKRRKL